MDYAKNIRIVTNPVKAKKDHLRNFLELTVPFLPYFIEPVISYFCIILSIPLLENRQAVSFGIFLMLFIDFQINRHKIPIYAVHAFLGRAL